MEIRKFNESCHLPGITPSFDTWHKQLFWLVADRVGVSSGVSILPLRSLGVVTKVEHVEELPAHQVTTNGGLISHTVDQDVVENDFLFWRVSTMVI